MISDAQLTPILPVVDVTRATIALMAAEEGTHSSHTELTFEVDDVYSEVQDLEGRGDPSSPNTPFGD